jgi:hypothetical protein
LISRHRSVMVLLHLFESFEFSITPNRLFVQLLKLFLQFLYDMLSQNEKDMLRLIAITCP